MGAQSCATRTCEKGWLCQTFSKRCATNNKYTLWVFVIGKYYKCRAVNNADTGVNQ